ncbi:putative lipoprotein [Staphylococcus aureus subsp. aureus 21239]|nr:putative lipoprotein [Staphylococcus aureus subsp. aureus 21239]
MKKVMGILLASTLILGACGHHQDSAKKESTSHKKKENDNEELNEELKEFKSKKNMDIKIKGDTIVSDKFEAKIKNRLSSMKKMRKRNISLLKWKLLLKKTIKI